MTPEQTLKVYENDVNAEANIRKSITDAYGGLKPEIEQVRTYENQQFPGFYNQFSGGTGAADLSPTTQLQNAWGNAARDSTTAQVARDAFDIRRGGMEDLISSGMNQWQRGMQGAQSGYDRWWAEQQAAEQKRQFDAQLALSASRGSGGVGGSTSINPWSLDKDLNNDGVVTDEELQMYFDMSQGKAYTPNPNYSAGGGSQYTNLPQTKHTPTNGYTNLPSSTPVPKSTFGGSTYTPKAPVQMPNGLNLPGTSIFR